MTTNDKAQDHTFGCADHKQATLEYIVEMLGELASLALGIGEAGLAEGLRGISNAHNAPSSERRKAPVAH